MALTSMQEKFCQNVASGMTDTEAYRQAGYSWRNMKEATLNSEAHALRRHAAVEERIAELMQPAAAKAEIDAMWCLQKLKALIGKADERGHSAAAIAGVGQIARIIGADKTVLRDERVTAADLKPDYDFIFEDAPAPKKTTRKRPPTPELPDFSKLDKPLLN